MTGADAEDDFDANGENEDEWLLVRVVTAERLSLGDAEALADPDSKEEAEMEFDARADAVICDADAEPVATFEAAALLDTETDDDVVNEPDEEPEREAVDVSELVVTPDVVRLDDGDAAFVIVKTDVIVDEVLREANRVGVTVILDDTERVEKALLVFETRSDRDVVDEEDGSGFVIETVAECEGLTRDEILTLLVSVPRTERDDIAVAVVERD